MLKADVVDVLRALNLLGGGALVGVVLAEAVVILPLVRSRPPADGVAAIRFAGERAWPVASACGATSWLSGIAVAVLLWSDGVSASGVLTLAGALLTAVAVGVTFLPYLAVDKRVRSLSAAAAPLEAPALLQRMAELHTLRTSFYALGFVCFTVGALV